MGERIKATICGSFQFKKEIDLRREELEDRGMVVLAPEKGEVYIPSRNLMGIREARLFRPLMNEKGMPIRKIEDDFLACLFRSEIVLVVNIGGYVGPVVAMEIGVALAFGKEIYSIEPIDRNLDPDPIWQVYCDYIKLWSEFTVRSSPG